MGIETRRELVSRGSPEDAQAPLNVGSPDSASSPGCLPPQNCMNLPPDKVQLLSQYDNEKKWELICDQVGTGPARHPVPCPPGWDG